MSCMLSAFFGLFERNTKQQKTEIISFLSSTLFVYDSKMGEQPVEEVAPSDELSLNDDLVEEDLPTWVVFWIPLSLVVAFVLLVVVQVDSETRNVLDYVVASNFAVIAVVLAACCFAELGRDRPKHPSHEHFEIEE